MNPNGSSLAPSFFERLARDGQGAPSLAAFRSELLKVVRSEVGADSAGFLNPPGSATEGGGTRTAGLGTAAEYVRPYLGQKQRYERSLNRLFTALRKGRPVIDSDVYGVRERERLAIYAEILLPQGTRSILATSVAYRGCTTGLVVLKRHGRGRAFQAKDADRFSSLLPALALADAGFQCSFAAAAPLHAGHLYWHRLSPREGQVAALLVKGMQNGEIAALLGTTHHTVKKQVQRVLAKCGASNRTELAGLLAAESLADGPSGPLRTSARRV